MSLSSSFMPNDLSDLCRVCLQLPEESQYLDLTTIYDEEDNLTYGECFTICTNINLSDGQGVPHNLCKSCGLELQMTYDFFKKVEDSKRVIEQCQKKSKETGLNASEENETSCKLKDPHDDDLILVDEIDNINNTDQVKFCEKHNGVLADSIQLESSQESKTDAAIEEHLDIDDYQNLEALEEEETETIQMKCGDNVIPMQITKYKPCDFEVSEEYVEFTEDDGCEEEDVECNESVLENDPSGTDLTWKDNVVTVANKEHIPIEIENGVELYKMTEINKNNEINTIISESSQDVTMEEDNDYDPDKRTLKKKQSINKNSVTRKRHVGSYECDVCQKLYPNYSRMMSHRRCHEADRPKFTCSHCGRMYATKQAMECHIQTAHEKSGYTCNICNKVFGIRKSLEVHVRYHTGDFPYACNLCDRKFAQACHLNTHINVKHNKIRFSCEYPNCGKFFTSSTSLRNHEFTHGVMPFECEYCQRGYPAKAKLRVHIKRKHGIDLSIDQLEHMRKFHIMRSKVNLVQFVES